MNSLRKIGETALDSGLKMKTSRKSYPDRFLSERSNLPELNVRIDTIDTMLLLFHSEENHVLNAVMKHIIEYIQKDEENINLLKEKQVIQLLLLKEFYQNSDSMMIKRLALYLATAIVEYSNTLKEIDWPVIEEVVNRCIQFYLVEEDDICLEFLSVMLNSCLNDPRAVKILLANNDFVQKFFEVCQNIRSPDVIWQSFELLEKMLQLQCLKDMGEFLEHVDFPINRLLCELSCKFEEIRKAALCVIKILLTDTHETGPFEQRDRMIFVLKQLTIMFTEQLISEPDDRLVIQALSTAIRNEKMGTLFFELNHFEEFCTTLKNGDLPLEKICVALNVCAECAQYTKFLPRLVLNNVTNYFIECLLRDEPKYVPDTHILLGLNRLIKSPEALSLIVEAFDRELFKLLLRYLPDSHVEAKTREQMAEFLNLMLVYAFHKTARSALQYGLAAILPTMFDQYPDETTLDLQLTMLNVVESLANNTDYREEISTSGELMTSLSNLLIKSFVSATLASHIFRCLCCLMDEDNNRSILLANYISSSIKRGLRSLSNVLKTSVTNFIMQTTRFPKYVQDYINNGVLEILIMHQIHAFCVPTWETAIESILAKDASLKFSVRQHLSFTDTTVNGDFFISKGRISDFRVFQDILRCDTVSPLHPMLVVNFNRPNLEPGSFLVIPVEFLSTSERISGISMIYTRFPADPYLPQLLDEVHMQFEENGLAINPDKRSNQIDFTNLAKRAEILAKLVANAMSQTLQPLDLNAPTDDAHYLVKCHLKELARELHTNFIPLGSVRTGIYFERAVLFKCLADQVGLPVTLQRSVDGRLLFNELPLPVELDFDPHCDSKSMSFMPWRMLRPTHIIDLMYNVGELYPIQSRQALQYLRLY